MAKTNGKNWMYGLVALAIICCVQPARAVEFVQPNVPNIIRTLIRFGALDIRDDRVMDLYGRVNECDLYIKWFKDDFKWQKIRTIMRNTIIKEITAFPTSYRYDAILQLGRFDFKQNKYMFTDKTSQTRANVFSVSANDTNFCTGERLKVVPYDYKFVLDAPLQIEGLPMSQGEGEVLLKRMDSRGNKDHLIYVSFNMRVIYVPSLYSESEGVQDGQTVKVKKLEGAARLDTHLDSVDFFEDETRTKLIYTYTP